MSKTFTSKPSVSYARGRGKRQTNETTAAGRSRPTDRETSPTRAPPPGQPRAPASRGRGRGVAPNARGGTSSFRGRGMDPQPPQDQDEPPSPEQRMSYQGGFTMITPNEKKRQAISEQAKRGLEHYDSYKQRHKLGHVSYVGTTGGGQMTMAESRQRMIDGNRFGKTDKLQKQQQYKEERKQKEETEFEKKKEQQRMKAESNKQREATQQAQDHIKYDEDMRRKREEFLNKLEGQSKRPGGVSTTGSRSAVPNDNSPLRLAAPATSSDRRDQRSYEYVPAVQRSQEKSPPGGQRSEFTDNEAAGGQSSQLETLLAMFPMYSTEILSDILNQTDSNVDQAVQLLSEWTL